MKSTFKTSSKRYFKDLPHTIFFFSNKKPQLKKDAQIKKKKFKWATSFYKTIQRSGFKNRTMTRGSQAAAVSVIEEKKKTPQFE